MPVNTHIEKLTKIEQLNFLITNRVPRRYLTLLMGWFSKIQNPVISRLSIGIWQLFAKELNLQEAKKSKFDSLHDCFIRELKPGAREIDREEGSVTSPCDGIVLGFGEIRQTSLYQAKGYPYTLEELLGDAELVNQYRNGVYLTLRLKATMYHRFHAPLECRITKVNYISGDTWNVNPIALKRIEKLYVKNERAVINLNLPDPHKHIALVPVAAILVAGIKLHCLPEVMDLRYKGPNRLDCNAHYQKGDELGYFQHGSTIIILASESYRIVDDIQMGIVKKMGQIIIRNK